MDTIAEAASKDSLSRFIMDTNKWFKNATPLLERVDEGILLIIKTIANVIGKHVLPQEIKNLIGNLQTSVNAIINHLQTNKADSKEFVKCDTILAIAELTWIKLKLTNIFTVIAEIKNLLTIIKKTIGLIAGTEKKSNKTHVCTPLNNVKTDNSEAIKKEMETLKVYLDKKFDHVSNVDTNPTDFTNFSKNIATALVATGIIGLITAAVVAAIPVAATAAIVAAAATLVAGVIALAFLVTKDQPIHKNKVIDGYINAPGRMRIKVNTPKSANEILNEPIRQGKAGRRKGMVIVDPSQIPYVDVDPYMRFFDGYIDPSKNSLLYNSQRINKKNSVKQIPSNSKKPKSDKVGALPLGVNSQLNSLQGNSSLASNSFTTNVTNNVITNNYDNKNTQISVKANKTDENSLRKASNLSSNPSLVS